MATAQIDLGLDFGNIDGNVTPENFNNYETSGNDYDYPCWKFTQGVVGELHAAIWVPIDYASGATLKLIWTSSATSGDVDWHTDWKAIASGEVLGDNTSEVTGDDSLNTAAPSVAFDHTVTDIALDGGTIAAEDILQLHLSRDGATDTMTADIVLIKVIFV